MYHNDHIQWSINIDSDKIDFDQYNRTFSLQEMDHTTILVAPCGLKCWAIN